MFAVILILLAVAAVPTLILPPPVTAADTLSFTDTAGTPVTSGKANAPFRAIYEVDAYDRGDSTGPSCAALNDAEFYFHDELSPRASGPFTSIGGGRCRAVATITPDDYPPGTYTVRADTPCPGDVCSRYFPASADYTVLPYDAPTLVLDPTHGPAGDSFTATYTVDGCSAFSYGLFYFEDVLVDQDQFGADCVATVLITTSPTATPGAHTVEAADCPDGEGTCGRRTAATYTVDDPVTQTLVVSPSSGDPGDTFDATYTRTGTTDCSFTVDFYFDPLGSEREYLGSASTTDCSATLEDAQPDALPGPYSVGACAGIECSPDAFDDYTINDPPPTLTLEPTSGVQGSTFDAIFEDLGCADDYPVDFYFDGELVPGGSNVMTTGCTATVPITTSATETVGPHDVAVDTCGECFIYATYTVTAATRTTTSTSTYFPPPETTDTVTTTTSTQTTATTTETGTTTTSSQTISPTTSVASIATTTSRQSVTSTRSAGTTRSSSSSTSTRRTTTTQTTTAQAQTQTQPQPTPFVPVPTPTVQITTQTSTTETAPTATPTPATPPPATPEPTPQPTPEPTPQPTPEPTPQPTPEPTPQPTPEPTAGPTQEPVATPPPATPEPSATPVGSVLGATSPPSPPRPERLQPLLVAAIPGPSEIDIDPNVLLTNLLLTILVILLFAVTSYIFNSTVDENRATIVGWRTAAAARLWPITTPLLAADRTMKAMVARARMTTFARVAVVLGLSAVIYGFLDPNFGLNAASLVLFIGLLVGLGISTYLAEGGSMFLAERRHRVDASVRLLGAGILVAIVCVAASRLIDFRPGFVFGFIASSVILTPIVLSRKHAAELVVVPALLTLIVSMLAWLALGPIRGAATDGSPLPVLLETIAAILFIGGLEAIAFSMIPLSFMDGVVVYRWNKIVWAVLFGTAVFLFWQLVINREHKYLEAFEQRNVLVCLALLAVYGGGTLLVWGYFRYRRWRQERAARAQGATA